MNEVIIRNEAEISNEWIAYIENEAKALASLDNYAIENYIDRELFNPGIREYFGNLSVAQFGNLKLDPKSKTLPSLTLNMEQKDSAKRFKRGYQKNFRALKEKIKLIFCKVIQDLKGENFDYKIIIKSLLVAVLPAFVGGIPAVTLAFIIYLIGSFIKNGVSSVCPV